MAYPITGGIIQAAKRIVIYGPEGIGKSTFASQFPRAVFIDTEGSTKEMDVRRFPAPTSWTMLLDEVREVAADPSICKTLVIDTADWAEQLEITELCTKNNWASIETPGYGKGYTQSMEEFGKLLNELTTVAQKGVNVVMTAHAQLRKIELPEEMGAYDHWEMKTSKKVAPLIREWADAVFFANYKTMVIEVNGKKKAQGGRRVMYTTHTPFWDAKNRYRLDDELPFDFGSVAHLFDSVPASPAKVSDPVIEPAAPEAPAAGVTTPEPAAQPKSIETPVEKTETAAPAPSEAVTAKPVERFVAQLDPGINPALRDLMTAKGLDEWDLMNVVSSKGYMPPDMPVRSYPEEFVTGWCIPWIDQIVEAAKAFRAKEEIPFS